MGLMKRKDGEKNANPSVPATAGNGAAKTGDGAGRGRKSQFTGKRIYLKVKENPCRKGSIRATHFDLVKEGMAYEDYIKAGGNNFNLKDGVGRKYFDVR